VSDVEHDRQFRLHSQCRSCNADVIWVKTEAGKWMPLNAEAVRPEEGRNHFVIRGDTAIAIPQLVFSDEPHYVSHFSTCPDAASWRRERKSA
jgi:hypothetical protein